MATATTLGVRDEFVNSSDGWIGVVQIGPHGEQKGTAVEPQGSVWLTEDEQILTANAPHSDEDNPFTNGTLQLRTRGANVKNRRPYGADVAKPHIVAEEPEVEPVTPEQEETGATPAPAEEPELGQAAAGEEVATPQAAMRPKPKPTARRRQS